MRVGASSCKFAHCRPASTAHQEVDGARRDVTLPQATRPRARMGVWRFLRCAEIGCQQLRTQALPACERANSMRACMRAMRPGATLHACMPCRSLHCAARRSAAAPAPAQPGSRAAAPAAPSRSRCRPSPAAAPAPPAPASAGGRRRAAPRAPLRQALAAAGAALRGRRRVPMPLPGRGPLAGSNQQLPLSGHARAASALRWLSLAGLRFCGSDLCELLRRSDGSLGGRRGVLPIKEMPGNATEQGLASAGTSGARGAALLCGRRTAPPAADAEAAPCQAAVTMMPLQTSHTIANRYEQRAGAQSRKRIAGRKPRTGAPAASGRQRRRPALTRRAAAGRQAQPLPCNAAFTIENQRRAAAHQKCLVTGQRGACAVWSRRDRGAGTRASARGRKCEAINHEP